MYPVSQEFLQKIRADERQVFAKLQVDYTDPFLDQSIEVITSENANVSFPSQTADAVAEPFAKIASLDGSWVLDGTYALAPTPREAEVKQMGWWGKQLAGTGGAFSAPYPTLTVSFFPRPITKLQAVGDSKRQEWPVDFNIKLYDGNNTLLHTETVTGNTQIAWSKTLDEPITQVEKMTLEITKWSHAGRQAKILEFFTSIQETYEGDDILLIHLLEEREVSQGSLPVGNISANEIDIRLNNETRKFDAGNKQSPLYQTLKANRRIRAWLGAEVESLEFAGWQTEILQDASPTGTWGIGSTSRLLAQGFKATGKLAGATKLRVGYMSTGAVNFDVHFFIYSDNRGKPGVPISPAAIIPAADWPPSGQFAMAEITLPEPLQQDAQYWIVAQGQSTSNTRSVLYSLGDYYHDGYLASSDDAGATWSLYTNRDYMFKVEIPIYATVIKPEWVPLGTFWSGDWHVPEDEVYAETTGRDRLELLRKSTYSTSEVVKKTTALHFDGTNYVTIPNIAGVIHGTEEASIDFWVKKDLVQYGFIQLSGFANTNGNLYPYNTETKVYLDIFRTSRLGPIYLNTTCLEWHHFAITTTPGANGWKLYQNGELIYSATGEPTVSTDYLNFEIGRNSGNRYAVGAFRDIKLWDRALTAEEIRENMHKPFYGNEKNLIGYWKFDSLDGIRDLTKNGNDGIISGNTPTVVDSVDITLYYLAHKILRDAGLTEEEYYIDTELQQFPVPYAWFDSQSHREALRKVAEACLGQVYCDRNGIIRIEGPSFLQSQSEPVATITQDDYFRKDNPVKWSEIANYVEVETQPLRPDIAQEVYRSNEPISITAGQTKTITAYYNHTPCIEATATLENAVSGAQITKATYYAWGADITVTSSNTGTFELVINAKPLKVLNKEKAIAKDDASITDNGKLVYNFPANPLVQTREVAQKIADTLLAYFKNPRRDVEVEWRGNPALLLGDKVAVVDKDEENEYFVTRQELEYTGALRARMSGRRA